MSIKGIRFKTDHKAGMMPTVGNYNALNEAAQLVANQFLSGSGWMNGAGFGAQQSAVHHQMQAIVTEELDSVDTVDGATHKAEAIFKLGTAGDWQDKDTEDKWEIRVDASSKPEADLIVDKVYDFYFDQNIGLWQPLISPLLTYPFQLENGFVRGGESMAKRLAFNDDEETGGLGASGDVYKKVGEQISVWDKFVGPGVAADDEEKENSIDALDDPPIRYDARGLYQFVSPDVRVIVFIHRRKHLARFIKFRLIHDAVKGFQTVTISDFWDGREPEFTGAREIQVDNELAFEGDKFAYGYAVRSTNAGGYRMIQLTCPEVPE